MRGHGIRQRLTNTDGSSIVSVLVAFIILLLGIAGFSTAVRTANDMVRRAEMLNIATGEVLEIFYKNYPNMPGGKPKKVKVLGKDGQIGEEVFTIHAGLCEGEYEVTLPKYMGTPGGDDGEEPETEKLKYDMYYYK